MPKRDQIILSLGYKPAPKPSLAIDRLHDVKTAEHPPCGGLYIHVPFCVRKCPYCAFYSKAAQAPDVRKQWFAALQREWASRSAEEQLAHWRPQTIFLGGGTPTALEPGELDALLSWIRSAVDVSAVQEWSVEANPGTLTPEKAEILKKNGVTRVSVGVQSLDAATLERLGRIHGPGQAREAVELVLSAGIPRVGADWMYGIPGIDEATARRDIEAIANLPGLGHVSCYALEIDEDTPFARSGLATDDRLQRRLYEAARRILRHHGFAQYELSNFAQPGAECRHNLLYWSGGAYIGLGPAAASHWHGVRSTNTNTLPRWRRAFSEHLARRRKACETLVFGLRRTVGWTRDEFFSASGGYTWEALRGPEIAALKRDGLLVETAHRLRLSTRALFISDLVFRVLI